LDNVYSITAAVANKNTTPNILQECISIKILFVYDIYKHDPQNDKVVPLKEMKDSYGVV